LQKKRGKKKILGGDLKRQEGSIGWPTREQTGGVKRDTDGELRDRRGRRDPSVPSLL